MTKKDIDPIFNANVKESFLLFNQFCLILNEDALIILNTSITANLALSDVSVYAVAKAAVPLVIQSRTADVKGRKILVNSISPGITPTAANTGELGRDE